MAKKIYDEKIDKYQDWGGDESTGNLPVAGNRVQEFIKEQLDTKAGVFHYDTTNNRYIVFADADSQDAYLADPTKIDLIIGTFDAPFNYSAEITLSSPTYNAILAGTKNNYIDFTFDTKNKSGQSVGEDVICTYTFIRNGVKKTVTERYRYGTAVHFNVDDYLDTGTNNVTVGIVGQNTLAATTIGITYQVIDLQLSSTYDVSTHYNLIDNPAATAAVPYQISGYGTKIMEWYVDGVQLEYIKVEDEIVDVATSRTKYISVENMNQGKHSLQFRAYTLVDGEKFYSNIMYYDLIIYTGADKNPIIAVATVIPTGNDILKEGNLQLHGLQQYIPYELNFGVYNPTGAANTEVVIAIDGTDEATVTSHNGEVNTYSLRPLEYGVKTLTLTAGTTIYTMGLNIEKSSTTLEPITSGLVLDLQALGKSNSDANREEWVYGIYETNFVGFQWNKASGWNNNRLLISNGAYIDVNIMPLSPDPTVLGRTLEFEFSTKNVSNDNAVICDLRDENETGLLITASEVTLQSAGGSKVTTKYKSNENIRVVMVINPKQGTANKGMTFIYTDGIASGADSYATTDNFTIAKTLRIGGTSEADVELKALRFYNAVLSSDQILNNYILYRDTTDELLSIYDKNNIYEPGTSTFSLDALAAQCPVLKVTGDIPTLENTTDKNMTIYVDAEYVNLQDPTKSFTTKGMRMRPQGTSSMGYPKKNFRIYTKYGTMWDYLGVIIQDGLYAFKTGSQPVNVWCFKADYAESSGTHNTGVARLWNQVMHDAQINGQYLLRTEAQKSAIAAGYPYDVRTCVDGFPCHIVYRLTEDSDWIYIGKYNFNNDKSTESVFGFRDIPGFDNSRMQCLEILNNGNHLALFEDMDNFDNEWDQAYEFRYPEERTDISDIKDVSTWIVSTRHAADTVYSGNITIAGEVKNDQNGTYVDNAENRQKKFSAEKWDYLDVYKVAAYYVYLMRFGAVDQVIKNAMFTTEGTQGIGTHCKWYFINYDNDTVIGVRNDGLLVYNYDINRQTIDTTFEALVYCYAGHESTLWNNLEADEEFMKVVSDVDNALYVAGLTYAKTIDMFDVQQSGKWCERVYNQDSQYKYIGPYTDVGTNNLYMLQGARRSHRRWWLSHRFDLYDSKFVSGAYKAKSIEFKAANTPIGLQFSITAGSDLYYGYGLNNVPVDTGIHLNPGESHTFTTKQVINVGDPVRIYSAVNIEGMDISNFISYLSTLNIAEVTGAEVGTKFKKLVMGVNTALDTRRNASLSTISGLAQATRLEYLDIGGYKSITNLDLSVHQYLTTLKAFGSGLTGLTLANGGLANYLELPSTMQALVLDNLPDLTASGLKIESEWVSVRSIYIRNCGKLESGPIVFNWYATKTTPDASCSLIAEGIDWKGVAVDNLLKLGGIKTAGGTLSLKGVIHLASITPAQVNEIKAVYGENCFNEDNELYISAPDGVFIGGPTTVLEGEQAQYEAVVFSENKGRVEYYLVGGGLESSTYKGCSIDKTTGLLTTTITNEAYNVTVRARHTPTQGNVVIADISVSITKRVYPTSASIVGEGQVAIGDYDYTLEVSASSPITGNYEVAWEVIDTTGYVSIKGQSKTGCIITVSDVSAEIVTFTLKATITPAFGSALIVSRDVLLSVADVAIVRSVNPIIMDTCYKQGWAVNPNYMTKEEAAAVTNIAEVFRATKATSFDEFQYFTGIPGIPAYAFYNSYLVSITFPPNNITQIAEYAFRYSLGLKKIDIPSSVTYVGRYSFSNSSPLEEAILPPHLDTLEEAAFMGCVKLKKVTMPLTITTWRANVFENCTSLTELVNGIPPITEDRIMLPSATFYNCALRTVDIPEGYTILGDNFFYGNPIETIVLPSSLIQINSYAFKNCTNLNNVEIPSKVVSLYSGCFDGCMSLDTITFAPRTRTFSLGANSFKNCNFTTFNISKWTIFSIRSGENSSPFIGCKNLTHFTVDDDVTAYKIGDKGELLEVISPTNVAVECYPYGRTDTSYTIPAFCSRINTGAFERIMGDPGSLTTVTWRSTLTSISQYAFAKSAITGLIQFNSTPSLGIFCFYNCPNITEAIIPYGNASMGSNLFSYCTNLTKVTIGEGFGMVAQSAFYLSGLTEVSFPSTITSIEDSAFRACKMTQITLPNSLVVINVNAFRDCANLLSIEIPESCVKVGSYCFRGCTALESIKLPSSIQDALGNYLLSGCPNCKVISVDKINAPNISKGSLIFGSTKNLTQDTCYTGYGVTEAKTLFVPAGATGYDESEWLDPLQAEDKCNFTISYTL